MSHSFMMAARIPMDRDAFERWLDTPAPDASVIANPGDMFTGWFWNGCRADDDRYGAVVGTTPREFFARRVEEARAGRPEDTVLSYRERWWSICSISGTTSGACTRNC